MQCSVAECSVAECSVVECSEGLAVAVAMCIGV